MTTRSATRRILVVDDNAPLRNIIRQHLESAGYEVEEAVDGEEAIRRLGEKPIQLVLLDMKMPKVDGIAVCKAVRGQGETAYLPIVMVSAQGTQMHIKQAADSGASDFIVKPFSKKTLLEKVARWAGPPAKQVD